VPTVTSIIRTPSSREPRRSSSGVAVRDGACIAIHLVLQERAGQYVMMLASTRRWMAPEQVRGKPHGCTAHIVDAVAANPVGQL
jgi:hypothetical protein